MNGLSGVDAFIAARNGSPWFVSMVGFVAGLPFMYAQIVDCGPRQLQVAEISADTRHRHAQAYDRPWRQASPGIYSVRCSGGYQMFGITPMPIFDPEQKSSYLHDFMVFFRPGDIVKFKPIGRDDYDKTLDDGGVGRPFALTMRRCDLRSPGSSRRIMDGYNAKLEGALDGR